ncbi:MAG: hypothetical protein IH977_10080 [Nitrospinae bacterium]|nr:hypothetical protein [Nitrospinota bacterium]
MRCEWCQEDLDTSRDHVFPRLLGGKLEEGLWVPACNNCCDSISKAEDEVAHRSHISALRFAKGLRPRHPERTTSGLVEPRISLVKDPETHRYSVFSLRLGEEHPEILPALEIDFQREIFHIHGAGHESVSRLVKAICVFFDKPPGETGEIGEIKVWKLEELYPEIGEDPAFNPRIYLSARGDLQICARDSSEADKVARILAALASREEFRSHSPESWGKWSIPGGTPHQVSFRFDAVLFNRVILKITVGLVGAHLRRSGHPSWYSSAVHDVVRGNRLPREGTVVPLKRPQEARPGWDDQLVAIVQVKAGRIKGYVGVYGEWYRVQPQGASSSGLGDSLIGAVSQVVLPKFQRWLRSEEVESVVRLLATAVPNEGT